MEDFSETDAIWVGNLHVGEKCGYFQWKIFCSRFGEKYKYGVCLKPSQYDMF